MVYGSSLLITLRNDKLFKDGFRLNFPFDLKLSFKSSRIHVCKKKKKFDFLLLKYKKEANLDYALERECYQVVFKAPEVRKFRCSYATYLTPFLVFCFLWGRGRGSFSFKICKVRLCKSSYCPLAYPDKTWPLLWAFICMLYLE